MSEFGRNRAVMELILPKARAWAAKAESDSGQEWRGQLIEGELFTEVCEIVEDIPRTFSVKDTAAKVWVALGLGS